MLPAVQVPPEKKKWNEELFTTLLKSIKNFI